MKQFFALALMVFIFIGCAKTLVVQKTDYYKPKQQPDKTWVSFPKKDIKTVMQRTWGDSWAHLDPSAFQDSLFPSIFTSGGQLSDNGVVAVKYGSEALADIAERVAAYLTGGAGDGAAVLRGVVEDTE
jgi:hypothetical protein